MKKFITLQAIVLITIFSISSVSAQNYRYASNNQYDYDLSEYLDLEAIASAFSFAENYQDLERRLNDTENAVSNLDLNGDGYVDYLRLNKYTDNHYQVIMIQAVLGQNYFQDVATILIDSRRNYRYAVQIIGEESLYGSNYVIEPVFGWEPPIMRWMRYSRASNYMSPYYWNYYPRYYGFRSILSIPTYYNHIHRYIDYSHRYNHSDRLRFGISINLFNQNRRNDFWRDHNDRNFDRRQKDNQYKNKNDFNRPENNDRKPVYNGTGTNPSIDRNQGRSENERRDPRPNENVRTRESYQSNSTKKVIKPRTDAGNERFRPPTPKVETKTSTQSERPATRVEPTRTTPRVETSKPATRVETPKPVTRTTVTAPSRSENTRTAKPAKEAETKKTRETESKGRR